MQKIAPPLLQEFRAAAACELCQKRRPVCPHHLFARGMGGGGRLDLRTNLISVCAWCHQAVHQGNIPRGVLLALVAHREGTTPAEVLEEIWRLRRTR